MTDHYGNTHCLVENNGDVIWAPPTHFQSFCTLDMRLWPFDTQVCTLVIGSWTHNGEQIDLQINGNGVVLDISVENHQWEVLSAVVTRNEVIYSCCAEPYLDLTYNVTLLRRSPMFKTVVITPAVGVIRKTFSYTSFVFGDILIKMILFLCFQWWLLRTFGYRRNPVRKFCSME